MERTTRWRGAGSHATAACVALAIGALSGACTTGTVTPQEYEQATGQPVPTTAAPVTQPEAPVDNAISRAIRGRIEKRGGDLAAPGSEPSGEVGAAAPNAEAAEQLRRLAEKAKASAVEIGFGSGDVVLGLIAQRAGAAEIAVRQVVLYPGYAIAEVTTPARPGELDRFVVRGGAVENPDPVRLSSAEGPLAAQTFLPSDITWAGVPALVEAAVATLAVPGGKPTHVIVERNQPFSDDVLLRVYISSDRGGGRVEFAPDGRKLKTYRD